MNNQVIHFKPDEDLQYIGRKFVIKIFALKNFKINSHQNDSRAFNILHYNFLSSSKYFGNRNYRRRTVGV